MSDGASIVIHCSSLRNPFIEAWFEAWRMTGARCVILADTTPDDSADYPDRLLDDTVFTKRVGGGPNSGWVSQVEDLVGGNPSALFLWWGLGSLSETSTREAWPSSRVVLCVDTLPNASRLSTEFREWARALGPLRSVDAFVTTSDQMSGLLQARFPHIRSRDIVVVTSPFALRAHASKVVIPDGPARVCFTGRSDFLHRGTRSMAKDDLGPWLTTFLERGVAVHVQRPHDPRLADALRDRGYDFYPTMTRASISDGSFADMVGTFHAQLAYYNVANATIRRRVSTGLSTRFATALCSPAPIVVPGKALFAREFFNKNPIGFAADNVSEITDRLGRSSESMREQWLNKHEGWTAEAFADDLGALIDK